jgi:hypothetical protein
MMAGSIQRWCKCAMSMTPSTVPMTSGTDQRRFPSQSISFRFVIVEPMPRKKEPTEVPDDGAVGDAREEELQERDGNEEPTADDDGEDADDEAAHEEQRRLARKQPGRERANPREIHHGTSP